MALSVKKSSPLALSASSKKWLIFVFTAIIIATIMSSIIHSLIVKGNFEEGQIATTTIRAPRDIIIKKEGRDGPYSPLGSNGQGSQYQEIKRGEVIVRVGDRISIDQALKLQSIKVDTKIHEPIRVWSGYFVLTSVLILSVYIFFSRFYPSFSTTPRDDTLLSLILTGSLILLWVFSILGHSLSETLHAFKPDTFLLAAPIASGGMILQIILGTPAVCIFVIILSVLTGVFLENAWLFLVLVVVGNLVGASGVKYCSKRSVFLRAGLRVAAVNVVVVLSFVLLHGELGTTEKMYRIICVFMGGIASGIISAGFMPFAEFFGQYTTDMKLLELSSLDQPLLRELSIQAPGTWNHSMVVGQMGEAAAEAIKANPLLVRVGAFYHDIGKSKYPAYFIENQDSENRHDKLTPSMSALIIKAHVKDGIEMAMEHRLPGILVDMIRQHHGTTLIEYFYDKAKKEAEEGETVDENNFRYSGPKPQTREAGILLLADHIEASSRTLPDPTPAKLQGLVQKIINKAFSTGELDESGLTLRDLHLAAKCFVRVLTGIYHRRVKYPESATEKTAKEKKQRNEEAGSALTNDQNEKSEKSENKPSNQTTDKKGASSGSKKNGDKDDTPSTLRRLGI
ncbi:MAG TPA: HDIG domain-containing protein [Oligoflexia bacterium]|nr:HDIG domain-containing protein [Oligoflexia bacterium]HMP48156.1 HDIG domain-containing protein [Oligoflexia bacterium]